MKDSNLQPNGKLRKIPLVSTQENYCYIRTGTCFAPLIVSCLNCPSKFGPVSPPSDQLDLFGGE